MAGVDAVRDNNNLVLARAITEAKSQEEIAQENSFKQRASETFGMEIPFGLALTGAVMTAPHWAKPITRGWQAWKMSGPDLTYRQAYKNILTEAKTEKEFLNSFLKNENNSWWQNQKNWRMYNKAQNWLRDIPTAPTGEAAARMSEQALSNITQRSNCHGYRKARALINQIKKSKLSGKALKVQLARVVKAMQEGDLEVSKLVREGKIRPTSRLGKIGWHIGKKSGYFKLKTKILRSPRAASGLRLAGKCAKGTGLFAIIGGGIELFTNIIPAIKADKENKAKGKVSNYTSRQIGKSAVSVGSSVLGYAAGAAAAGAVAGSVCPGLGNVAGAIVGFVGGCIGALAFGWGANELTKCNEREADKHNNQVAEDMAKEADKSPEAQRQLIAQAVESGKVSPEEVANMLEAGLNDREAQLQGSSADIANSKYQKEYALLNSLTTTSSNYSWNA